MTSTPVPNFIAITLQGAYPKRAKYCGFVTFLVLSRPGYTFFLPIVPPGRILTVYGLNDASSPKDVPFGGLSDHPQYQGVQNAQKTPKRGRG